MENFSNPSLPFHHRVSPFSNAKQKYIREKLYKISRGIQEEENLFKINFRLK